VQPEPTTEARPIRRNGGEVGRILDWLARGIDRLDERGATGDLATLRRLDPDRPNAGAFFRLMALAPGDPLDWPEDRFGSWGLVVWMLAQSPGGRSDRTLGAALAEASFSEVRMNRLLAARGDGFRAQVRHMVRFLAQKSGAVPYRELGELILCEGDRETRAERLRLKIARDYWRSDNLRETQTDTVETPPAG